MKQAGAQQVIKRLGERWKKTSQQPVKCTLGSKPLPRRGGGCSACKPQLDQEPAIVVCQPDAALQLAPQNDQLMSEYRILSFKPALRLEWRGQDSHYKTQQRDHRALTLGDSFG